MKAMLLEGFNAHESETLGASTPAMLVRNTAAQGCRPSELIRASGAPPKQLPYVPRACLMVCGALWCAGGDVEGERATVAP